VTSKLVTFLAGIRRPAVDHLFLVYRGGTLLVHLSRTPGDEDSDLTASMFTAIDSFVNDALRHRGGGHVRSIELTDYHVAMGRGRHTLLFIVYRGRESNRLERHVEREARRLEDRHEDVLKGWDGDMDRVAGIRRNLERRWGLRDAGKGPRRIPAASVVTTPMRPAP